MIYMPRQYRLANHVGGVRVKLAKMIVAALAQQGIQARCEAKDLWPARGYWRQIEQDVYSWEGRCETLNSGGEWMTRSLGSWDRMSSCVKGLKVTPDGFSFEVHANDEIAPEQRFKALRIATNKSKIID